jgi:hypothetical protein
LTNLLPPPTPPPQLEQLAADKASLHRDKVDLENQLEAEQEYIMNKLTKQVDGLAADKGALQRERSELQRQVRGEGREGGVWRCGPLGLTWASGNKTLPCGRHA